MKKTALFLFTLIFTTINNLSAQSLKTPVASPSQTLKQGFSLGEISIEYSRPSAKGRTVFGDLVPFGKVWRTGANAATKVTFTEEVMIENTTVPAGTYALYSIPDKDTWQLMLYKDLTLGGEVNDYKQENELARFKVKATTTANKTETFTITVDDITSTACNISISWENTKVSLPVRMEIDAKVMKNIETAMSPADKRPFYQAANYYYENNKDMKQALEWINKAVEMNPKAYWVYTLKSKIQIKMNDFKGAVETSEKAIQLATEDKDDTYVNTNRKLIEQAKKNIK